MDHRALVDWILTLDDAAVAELLRQSRYGGPHPEACRACGGQRFRRSRDRVRVDICKRCGTEHSVTARTAFHRVRLPLSHILAAAVLITREGSISSRALAKCLKVPWQTARFLGHRIREALAREPRRIDPEHVQVHVYLPVVRLDRGERDDRTLRPRLTLLALVDERTGACAVAVTQAQKAYALKRLVERELPGVQEVDYATRQLGAASRIDLVLRTTHQRVSRRWLELYVGALAWSEGRPPGIERAWGALGAALASERRTWVRLRPAKMQDIDPPPRFRRTRPAP